MSDVLDSVGEVRDVVKTESEKDLGKRVLSDVDVLAAEVLSDKRLLAVFLELGLRPRQAKELVDTKVYHIHYDKDRYGDTVAKAIAKKLPRSTMYRILKKLVETGLAETYRGIDYRKKYYKLTDLGAKVYRKVVSIIRKLLLNNMKTPREIIKELKIEDESSKKVIAKERGKMLSEKEFKKLVVKELGLDPEVVAQCIDAKKITIYVGRYGEPETLIVVEESVEGESRGRIIEALL